MLVLIFGSGFEGTLFEVGFKGNQRDTINFGISPSPVSTQIGNFLKGGAGFLMPFQPSLSVSSKSKHPHTHLLLAFLATN